MSVKQVQLMTGMGYEVNIADCNGIDQAKLFNNKVTILRFVSSDNPECLKLINGSSVVAEYSKDGEYFVVLDLNYNCALANDVRNEWKAQAERARAAKKKPRMVQVPFNDMLTLEIREAGEGDGLEIVVSNDDGCLGSMGVQPLTATVTLTTMQFNQLRDGMIAVSTDVQP